MAPISYGPIVFQSSLTVRRLGEEAGGDAAAYETLLPRVEELLVGIGTMEHLWKVCRFIASRCPSFSLSRSRSRFRSLWIAQ